MVDDVECSRLVEREVLNLSLDIPNDNQIGLNCGSIENEEDKYIREGNRTYLILTFENNEWSVRRVICKQCCVRDAVERLQDSDNHVAVVEAGLNINLPDSEVTFQEPEIWELIK